MGKTLTFTYVKNNNLAVRKTEINFYKKYLKIQNDFQKVLT